MALFRTIFAAAVTAAVLPTCAVAQERFVRETGEPGKYSYGYVRLCQAHSEQCRAVPRTRVSRAWSRKIGLVNAEVNARIRPVAEPRGSDEWRFDVSEGDCEDFALTKRMELWRLGAPWGAMAIAFVDSASTGKHAVLVIMTDGGDLVLDNLTDEVLVPGATQYEWISVAYTDRPLNWASVYQPRQRTAMGVTK